MQAVGRKYKNKIKFSMANFFSSARNSQSVGRDKKIKTNFCFEVYIYETVVFCTFYT